MKKLLYFASSLNLTVVLLLTSAISSVAQIPINAYYMETRMDGSTFYTTVQYMVDVDTFNDMNGVRLIVNHDLLRRNDENLNPLIVRGVEPSSISEDNLIIKSTFTSSPATEDLQPKIYTNQEDIYENNFHYFGLE